MCIFQPIKYSAIRRGKRFSLSAIKSQSQTEIKGNFLLAPRRMSDFPSPATTVRMCDVGLFLCRSLLAAYTVL